MISYNRLACGYCEVTLQDSFDDKVAQEYKSNENQKIRSKNQTCYTPPVYETDRKENEIAF